MNSVTLKDMATLATVTVTFNPDIRVLESQLRTLPENCVKIIVDNASQAGLFAEIESLVQHVKHVQVLRNETNIGLAAAINRGIRVISGSECALEFVVFLDQDSEPRPGSIELLLNAFKTLEAERDHVGCVGPSLVDSDTCMLYGFHQRTRWRWKRIYPSLTSTAPVICANLNGSGTLTRISLFRKLGGLDKSLFIDHVDTEWAFRVLDAGYTLWGIPNAVFTHRMGLHTTRFWFFGRRLWPSRSPQRHYYLFRNAITLMRRHYVPSVWKTWGVVKLFITVCVVLVIGPRRKSQLMNMCQGIGAGFRTMGVTHERDL